jgi:Tol biopolymer transport system component
VVGSIISHYRIVEKIGEGGMGVVYKAQDTKLDRVVALKFLAPLLLNSDDAKKRFLREAKAAAALHHPNICTVFEIDEAEGTTFLAMAYLPGTTLAKRIEQGPLPLNEALDLGRQVAEGLQAAHDANIVHRDIKPANILISPDGRATIMDFGLARLSEVSQLTRPDAAIGTAAYMSPEQALGTPVDYRCDIWALGCVLHEMIAGLPPFRGEYRQALFYEIVEQEPEPLTSLRAGLPRELEFIAGKCLAKEADGRYQHANEIAIDLRNLQQKLKSGRSAILRTDASGVRPANLRSPGPEPFARLLIPVAAMAILAVALAAFWYLRSAPSVQPVVEFSAETPGGVRPGSISMSPDGRYLVISAYPQGSLWLRSLDSQSWRQIEGVAGARYPFWSPDGAWIAFFEDERLRKIPAGGGPAQTIAPAGDGRGGTWGVNGTILFAASVYDQIQSVPASGGEPMDVTKPLEGSAPSRRFPFILPDGRHFLYTEDSDSAPDESGIFLGSLDGAEPRRLLPDPSNAVFAPSRPGSESGHLLFVREGALTAQPFDASRLELSGGPFALAATPAPGANAGYYGFSASASGVLAHSSVPGEGGPRRLVWVDRTGSVDERTSVVSADLFAPRISPDGLRIAYEGQESANGDVWIYDTLRATRSRLTTDPGADAGPIWSPGGDSIIFRSGKDRRNFFLRKSDGSGSAVTLAGTGFNVAPTDWSPDGRRVVYRAQDPAGRVDLWYLERSTPSDSEWTPRPFLATPAIEVYARLSPNGRYAAYVSDESGRREVYVQPFPAGGPRTIVSTQGGGAPVWSADGKELFYVTPDNELMAASVTTEGEFKLGAAARLFKRPNLSGTTTSTANYDIARDGRRFIAVEPADLNAQTANASPQVGIVLNWPAKFAPAR